MHQDGASGKEPARQCRRCKRRGFNPWVRKIPWKRAWQPTPVFLPGEFHGQRAWWATAHGVAKSWAWLKQCSMHVPTCSKLKPYPDMTSWTSAHLLWIHQGYGSAPQFWRYTICRLFCHFSYFSLSYERLLCIVLLIRHSTKGIRAELRSKSAYLWIL